ncbi:hypothetical protein D3C72_2126520 [compost metagenome]
MQHRVALRISGVAPLLPERRVACLQLAQQVFPFVSHLAAGDGNGRHYGGGAELAAVKTVAALGGLLLHGPQVGVDRQLRRGVGFEPVQLGMVAIAFGEAMEHMAREQALAPQRNQALRIKVPGVHRPKTHG